jgi:hypothetical protein
MISDAIESNTPAPRPQEQKALSTHCIWGQITTSRQAFQRSLLHELLGVEV